VKSGASLILVGFSGEGGWGRGLRVCLLFTLTHLFLNISLPSEFLSESIKVRAPTKHSHRSRPSAMWAGVYYAWSMTLVFLQLGEDSRWLADTLFFSPSPERMSRSSGRREEVR